MQVILLRHGTAEQPLDFLRSGRPDAARPLTNEGTTQIGKLAEAMNGFVKNPDLIVSSTLLRAKQTADIVAKVFPQTSRLETEDLSPESEVEDFLPWLKEYGSGLSVVIVVGHEPNLCALANRILGVRRYNALSFPTGGMACFEIQSLHEIGEGTGQLLWLVQPELFS